MKSSSSPLASRTGPPRPLVPPSAPTLPAVSPSAPPMPAVSSAAPLLMALPPSAARQVTGAADTSASADPSARAMRCAVGKRVVWVSASGSAAAVEESALSLSPEPAASERPDTCAAPPPVAPPKSAPPPPLPPPPSPPFTPLGPSGEALAASKGARSLRRRRRRRRRRATASRRTSTSARTSARRRAKAASEVPPSPSELVPSPESELLSAARSPIERTRATAVWDAPVATLARRELPSKAPPPPRAELRPTASL